MSEVIRVELAKGGKFLSLYNLKYTDKNGNLGNWEMATRKDKDTLIEEIMGVTPRKTDAVVIVAIHEETKSLVAIKQFRVPIGQYIYELPAGLIDEGEDAIESARRELKEETGLDMHTINLRKSRNVGFASPGMCDETVTLVYCTCRGDISTAQLEAEEDIEVVLLSQEDALELLASGEPMGVKLLMALHTFVGWNY